MAHQNNNQTFLTPDRRPQPDKITKRFSTTAARGIYKNLESPELPQYQGREINRKFQPNESTNGHKLNWFQSKAAELREYLNDCPKIEKRKIREIFNWQEKVGTQDSEQKRLIKELGQKVSGLIKMNNKLKNTIYNGQITELRIQNERLKFLLENIHKGEESRSRIMVEENELMKTYIEKYNLKRLDDRMYQDSSLVKEQILNNEGRKPINKVEIVQELSEQKEPLFNKTPVSIERLKNLKKYFTMYVNTAIQQNDQRFDSQQKYIDSLQKRIIQLQKIDKRLEHSTFQKRVKLQDSQRKSRNFTVKAPRINGQVLQQEDISNQIDEGDSEVTRKKQLFSVNYFQKKQRTIQNIPLYKDLQEQVQRLRAENNLLKQSCNNLQQKYEVEIEKHIRDMSDKQKLTAQVQILTYKNIQLLNNKQFKSRQPVT